MCDNYILNHWIAINKMRGNSSETQGCASRNLNLRNPLPVMEGDRIAVRVRNQCGGQCPLQPNLNASGSMSVFFTQPIVTTIPVSQVMATESYTNVYLDVSVSIGELNVWQ